MNVVHRTHRTFDLYMHKTLGVVSNYYVKVPVVVQVIGWYLVARFFTLIFSLRIAQFQQQNPWTPAQPDYGQFASLWDAGWYQSIVTGGYPLPLPLGDDGAPRQSEWAFFPAYPMVVRLGMEISQQPFTVVAPAVSFLCGIGAAVVLYYLFRSRASHVTALSAVILYATYPASPVLQYSYTESLAMLMLSAAMLALTRRSYWVALIPVAVLSLTRPIGLPFALVVLAHLVWRWYRRHRDHISLGNYVSLITLGLLSAGGALAFPLAVGYVTGQWDNYYRVQEAWHGGTMQRFTPWWDRSQMVFGDIVGPIVLVTWLLVIVWVVLGRLRHVLGLEMAVWLAAYTAYLLAVVQPWTSIFRYWLLAFPVALAVAWYVRSKSHLLTWVLFQLSLQVVWIWWVWRFIPPTDHPP